MFADLTSLRSAFAEAGQTLSNVDARRILDEGDGFGEPLFRHLGAVAVESLDASDYEGSSIVHDLNDPFPEALKSSYSLVLDSGTLEHVFDYPRALKNCLEAVVVGGHFVTITPANNLMGHGFYQLSPELFFRVLTPENGFQLVTILLRADRRAARWYRVTDPATIKQRVTLSGLFPEYLYVVAKRTHECDPLRAYPQQSDYSATWSERDGRTSPTPVTRPPADPPVLRRLPGAPLPLLNASEWLRLATKRNSTNGLAPVALRNLGSFEMAGTSGGV